MAKRRFRKRRFRKKGKRNNKIVKRVVRELGGKPELKMAYQIYGGFTANYTGGTSTTLMNPVIAGTYINKLDRGVLRNMRIGDKINVHEINVRFAAYYRTNANQANWANLRVMMSYDKDTEGTGWTFEDMFGQPSVAGSTYLFFPNPYTHKSERRFRTLYDKIHYFDLGFNSAQGNANAGLKTITIRKKFKNPLPVQYYRAATVGTIADIESGDVSLWIIQSGPTDACIDIGPIELQVLFTDT